MLVRAVVVDSDFRGRTQPKLSSAVLVAQPTSEVRFRALNVVFLDIQFAVVDDRAHAPSKVLVTGVRQEVEGTVKCGGSVLKNRNYSVTDRLDLAALRSAY